ncbi:hypothetical protein A7E78_05620 [Syntrophotalea acetylenivorans]|uniref:Uncharacterized protein n=1 Tax=Syntrophotalea acetylenivorans TaxID=1842532 RepID=A0A1L3GN46_9BACT|nr:PilZ domain-containing protein [Syntrophotalea acetylenivorans]APG27366.1 hypothetical protein A7E78_05620 [Syntrophotalea acetylenivorans]
MATSPPCPINLLENFADCRMVKVTIPLLREESIHLDGVVKDFTESSLDIHFPSQPLPLSDLAEEGQWRVTFDKGISFLTLWTSLATLVNPSRVQLNITGSETNHYARRDHRVDTEVYLRYWQAGDGRQELPPQRTRVNLSGYGVSFQAQTTLAANSLVELEIFLPGGTLEKIRCVGRIIRGSSQEENCSVTALELVNPGQDDIEKIINFCMTVQFRDMQQKARMLVSSMGPDNT